VFIISLEQSGKPTLRCSKQFVFIPTAVQSFDELNGGDQALARSTVSAARLGYSPHGQSDSHAQI
jgi:hypothetical protein